MNYLYPEIYPEMLVGINRTVVDKIRFKTNRIVANKGRIKIKRKTHSHMMMACVYVQFGTIFE